MTRFVAKIMDTNTASLKFFRSMNFETYEHDDDFEMTHLHRHITKEISDSLLKFETFAWVCKSIEPMSTRTSLNWIGMLLSRRNKHNNIPLVILLCYHYLKEEVKKDNVSSRNNLMLHGTKVKLVPYGSVVMFFENVLLPQLTKSRKSYKNTGTHHGTSRRIIIG